MPDNCCHKSLLRLLMAIAIIAIATSSLSAEEAASVPDFRHVRVENPASLTPEESERIYRKIYNDLSLSFERSGIPQIQGYRNWKRYNTFPYMSSTHGNRYINNFANNTASDYGALSKGSAMPVGSVLIKDSFAVWQDGDVIPGRLFVMEKLYAGSRPSSSDWRYIMIDADGSVIADTTGKTAKQADFCHVCHKVRASSDFLFFIPPSFRAAN